MSDEEVNSTADRRLNAEVPEIPPGNEKNDDDRKVKSSRPKSPDSSKRKRTRSRSRSFDRRRSRSFSPDFYRGGRRRFFRRSRSHDRFRGRFRDRSRDRGRFYGGRRSRSRSRSRSRGRRFDRRNRRSNSRNSMSPQPPPAPQYQQQPPPPPMYNDPNYAAYPGYMQQGSFSYEYGAAYPPPAPQFIPQPPAAPNMILPGPPGDEFMGQTWAPMVNAPPPTMPENTIQESEEEKSKREEAVKKEMKTQREALKKQRDEYLNRSQNLKRELKILKQKRSDLIGSQNANPPSPRTNSFVKENDKLQSQITNKLNTIMNVIDMLNGLIGKESDKEDEVEEKKRKSPKPKSPHSDESSPERLKSEVLESMNKNKEKKIKSEADDKKKINYIFYDPELHFCDVCNVFPKTAKDYLNHLQSKEHSDNQGEPETPWRENKTETTQNHPDAVTKRTPIRGLQFFVPSAAWYCKLCSFWMGDLATASAHLKSDLHSDKYNNYVSQNPSFEVDWMSQRQHAYDFYREHESSKQKDQPESKSRDKLATPAQKLDQIPLNIGASTHPTITIKAPLELPKKDKDDKKKKKKKSERSKKKKKRGKKRKNRDSSSSSSSDSDSNSSSSESDKEKAKDSQAASIRVAMRKFLIQNKEEKGKPEQVGKWTMVPESQKMVPPPPPAISETQIKEKKRDELMIQQWVSPEPIISQAEKQLLEKLKGRLKTQGKEAPKIESKEREKGKENEKVDREREREKIEKDRERIDRERSREKVNRDRSRERGRIYRRRNSRESFSRSRSRDRFRRSRSRSHDRFRRNRRYSRSRSRSGSHSRYRRVEKPIVPSFPTEPRLPPLKEREEARKAKLASKREEKPPKSSSNSNRKLPFIGRMPVFKKQIEKKQEADEAEKPIDELTKETEKQQEPADMEVCYEDDMGLMPDPLAYSALMGAPPPPPVPTERRIEEILPPGIDEIDRDSIPKPISDAPIPRKGPLPLEFQETLNILFDGDKPKPVPEMKPAEIPAPPPLESPDQMDNDAPHILRPEDVYSQLFVPPIPPTNGENLEKAQMDIITSEIPIPELPDKKAKKEDDKKKQEKDKHNGIDLDELALLGIDADDLCMTSFSKK